MKKIEEVKNLNDLSDLLVFVITESIVNNDAYPIIRGKIITEITNYLIKQAGRTVLSPVNLLMEERYPPTLTDPDAMGQSASVYCEDKFGEKMICAYEEGGEHWATMNGSYLPKDYIKIWYEEQIVPPTIPDRKTLELRLINMMDNHLSCNLWHQVQGKEHLAIEFVKSLEWVNNL